MTVRGGQRCLVRLSCLTSSALVVRARDFVALEDGGGLMAAHLLRDCGTPARTMLRTAVVPAPRASRSARRRRS